MSDVTEDAYFLVDLNNSFDDIFDSNLFADDFEEITYELITNNYCQPNTIQTSYNYLNSLNVDNMNSNQYQPTSSSEGTSGAYLRTDASNENTAESNNSDTNNSNNFNTNNNENIPNNNNNRNNNQHVSLLGVRDRLFHALFFRGCLMYARVVSPRLRRILEFIILVKAVVAFFILIYVHSSFIHKPTTCLSHVQDSWPRDGILRVEILRNGSKDYSIENSYEKEKQIRQQRAYEMNVLVTSFRFPFDWFGDGHVESSYNSEATESATEKNTEENVDSKSYERELNGSAYNWEDVDGNENLLNVAWTNINILNDIKRNAYENKYTLENNSYNETIAKRLMNSLSESEPEHQILGEPSDIEKFVRAVWPDEEYIVEFSLEYGFLRLSPPTRQKLNIPVKIVTLNPNKDVCFGDQIMRFILEHIIGYDDLLMISIKSLAEKENDKGFLRNVVTGEHYRFVTLWMSRMSYILAFGIMLAFTLSISMLLRYSHHQIFIFIVNLLQMAEFNTEINFPAAPLFTVILALIGMEAVMSEFFNDSSTAFYIILIVWIADQYESICCQRAITKKHWIKFFYLYHYSFYAYHYRFNGQFSGLALVTSWLFIEHSMIYFLHHYELPMMLRRYQLQQFVLSQRANNGNGDSVAFLSPGVGDLTLNNNNNYTVGNEQVRFVAVNGADEPVQPSPRRSRFSIPSILDRYRSIAISVGLLSPDDRSTTRPTVAGTDTIESNEAESSNAEHSDTESEAARSSETLTVTDACRSTWSEQAASTSSSSSSKSVFKAAGDANSLEKESSSSSD